MTKLSNNKTPLCSPKRGENLNVIQIIWVLILLVLLGANIFLFIQKSKRKEAYHHVTVKFVGGNKTKLILNAEQYEQLQATLNQKDGFFEIGDDLDNVKFYREHVCAVEVKKK